MGRETRLMNATTSGIRKVLQSGSKSERAVRAKKVHNTEPSTGWRPGDDILFAGEEKVVDEIFDKSKGDMILKKRATLGFAENDDKHCTILNLIDFTVSESGPIILYEPGRGHVELLLEHLGLDGTKIKGMSTPGEKCGTYHDETELEKSKVTLYTSCVMRFAFFF